MTRAVSYGMIEAVVTRTISCGMIEAVVTRTQYFLWHDRGCCLFNMGSAV